jgi:hypothetical protein
MNRPKRDQAVRVFMSKDKARVMLMSMKCGGTGDLSGDFTGAENFM